MDTNRLCELTSAADSLQLKPLVDLTSRALARMIEGKTPEEIHETFHILDDFTEVFCAFMFFLNYILYGSSVIIKILYARKRKELKENEKLKVGLKLDRFSQVEALQFMAFGRANDHDYFIPPPTPTIPNSKKKTLIVLHEDNVDAVLASREVTSKD
ncbi:SKP1-like protein 21 [Tanacetum coccineum]